MRAAHGRRVGLSSMLLLVLLLVASSRRAAGYSVTKDSDGEARDFSSLTMDDGVKGGQSTATMTTKKPTTKKPTTKKPTTSSTLDTVTHSSSEGSTWTSESSTSASESSTSMSESSTSMSESSTSVSESSTLASESSTSTDDGNLTSKNPTSTLPPVDDLKVFENTRDELNEIEATLDKFLGLIENEDQPSERTAGGGRPDLPAAWWKLGKEAKTSEDIDNICKKDYSGPSAELCKDLQDHLKKTESLVSSLNNNVDAWDEEDLSDLKTENVDLSDIYTDAKKDQDEFKDSVDTKTFTSAIEDVKQEVDSSIETVNRKIAELTDNPGSVALVAVIGTFGGLMVVGLVSVMAYGVVKKGKLKKKSSSSPYNKLKGENIPINGFLSDGPEPSPTPRVDPYVRGGAPSNRRDNYATPYGPKSESNYRGPIITRVGQGLPRTHL